jgi:hypothetical protein
LRGWVGFCCCGWCCRRCRCRDRGIDWGSWFPHPFAMRLRMDGAREACREYDFPGLGFCYPMSQRRDPSTSSGQAMGHPAISSRKEWLRGWVRAIPGLKGETGGTQQKRRIQQTEEQMQVLRLTTPKLKSVWGPFRSG